MREGPRRHLDRTSAAGEHEGNGSGNPEAWNWKDRVLHITKGLNKVGIKESPLGCWGFFPPIKSTSGVLSKISTVGY